MKRILMLATVTALMAVMLVVMASAALADQGPPSGDPGCEGGRSTPPTGSERDSPHGTPQAVTSMFLTRRKLGLLLGLGAATLGSTTRTITLATPTDAINTHRE